MIQRAVRRIFSGQLFPKSEDLIPPGIAYIELFIRADNFFHDGMLLFVKRRRDDPKNDEKKCLSSHWGWV
jgi:hypothetical protein